MATPNTTEISVLTYNVRGLPFPVATGRDEALRKIGAELAQMRLQGRQPTLVLIQEGFLGDIDALARASGYAYRARGPVKGERASGATKGFQRVAYISRGEGWGKLTGAGLHVLSDLPITEVKRMAFRACAGWDCLANKGAMIVRVRLPGGEEADVLNTHMNAKGASGVPRARSSAAHNLQLDELFQFVADNRSGAPLLIGGDFNVRNAPERYDHRAAMRPYTVVSEYCAAPANGCIPDGDAKVERPWLKSQDLQAFAPGRAVEVKPLRTDDIFSRDAGQRLSDHDGYLVRYRLSWTARPAPQQVAALP